MESAIAIGPRTNDSNCSSAQFALAVECCRWTFAGADPSAIHRLAASVQWDQFVRVSRRHRIEGLVWHCLRSHTIDLPPTIERALATDAEAVAQHNLRAAWQSALILETFRKAGIPLIFIKGLSLGKLAYGDPFLKTGWDIDILVAGEQVLAAAAELERLGNRQMIPGPGGGVRALQQWHRDRKESVWHSERENMTVELHSRLADNPDLIPVIGMRSPTQLVEIAPGILLPTLSTDDLFAYLCVHGASSAWFRLKWLADLAALLNGCASDQITRLYQRSQELGAGRAAALALLLVQGMFETQLEPTLSHELESDRTNRWLLRTVWRLVTQVSEPTELRFGTSTIHLTQFFLRPGLGFKIGELRRQVYDALGNRN